MARKCSLCHHPRRDEIEDAIARGEPYKQLAERYGTSTATIARHRQHAALPQRYATRYVTRYKTPNAAISPPTGPALLDKLEHAKLEDTNDLKAYLENLNGIVLAILRDAMATGRAGTALQAARELRQSLELIAELLYVLDRRPNLQIGLIQSPEWIRMREIIASALEPYPEARLALARALEAARA